MSYQGNFVLVEVSAYDIMIYEDEVCMQHGDFTNAVTSCEDRWVKLKGSTLNSIDLVMTDGINMKGSALEEEQGLTA